MAVVEKFLGKRVKIPEDRRYDPKQGLWGKEVVDGILFGMTEPALVLMGGVKDLDWLVEEGQTVTIGESVVFAITGKILYIDAPVAGRVVFNNALREEPVVIGTDPYGEGWLFRIRPEGETEQAYRSLVPAREYLEKLRGSEGFKNPDGLKGGVSGICKAVYTGIGAQKI